MLLRLFSTRRFRFLLLGLLVFLVFQRPAAVRGIEPTDTLARARYLAWLNNWSEASRVLDRMQRIGHLDTDKRTRIFARAVEIRGNIEALSLPSAAKELDAILATADAQKDPGLQLQILAMKGDVEFQYDLPAAEKTWTEVGRLAAETGQYAWEVRAGGELGCVAFLNGEVNTALRRVVTAYLRAEVSGDVAEKMKTLTALGEGLAEFGRPADAVRFFTRVLEISAANPDAYFPFTAYIGKARLLLPTTASGEGHEMLVTGLAEARRERMRVREARILMVLGADAIRVGDRPGAVRWLTEAVDVARQAGLDRIEAEASSHLAGALSVGGDFDGAEAYAKASIAAAERTGDTYHLPQQLATVGEIEGNRGDLAAATSAYDEAIRRVTSFFADLPSARHENTVVATMGDVFQGYFDLALNRLDKPGLAFKILESARARGLVDRIRESQSAGQTEARDPAMIRKIADLNRRLVTERGFADRGQLLDRLWETEVRSLRFDSEPSEPAPAWTTQPVTLRELQSKLGPGELLIEYSLGQYHSSAFAITHDHAAPYTLKGRKEIETAISRQNEAIQKRRDGKAEGKTVYALLLAPIDPLAHSTRVIVVPDGKVNMAPLGAAVDPQGRYFIETHVLSFAPSATAFSLLSTPKRPGRRKVEVLGVGGARYPGVPGSREQTETRAGGLFALAPPAFSNLVRSGAEVSDLAAAGDWETLPLTGDNAAESVLKRLVLSNFNVLHFSLHSAIDRDFPDRSGLVLTPHSGDDHEDDLLQAREIMGLKLNADLVTLSACDGAAGTPEGMAGTNSLVQAFLMAGARTVVASVWEADDAFTAAMMRRFYSNLHTGHDKAEALTLAKRELLEEWGDAAAPILWAGFRIVGDAHGTI